MRITHTGLLSPGVVGMLVLAGLAACGAPEQASTQATSVMTPRAATAAPMEIPSVVPSLTAPTAVQNASQAAPTAAPATTEGWPTYRNDQAGYSIAYPPGWAVQEQVDGGMIVTTFGPSGAPGITVSMQATDTEPAEPLDLPAGPRCQPIVVGGITGLRCRNVVTLRVPASPGGQGKSYIIASADPGIDQALFQRFLDSFSLTQ